MKSFGQIAMALVLGAVAAAGIVVGVDKAHANDIQNATGIMPTVEVTADAPRLVMDTVYVTAYHAVAQLPSEYRAN